MNPKVLVVDDDPEFAELIKYNLERQTCDVLLAGNALEGLHMARLVLPDVILLDLMLPDMDGQVACRILQTQPSTRNIPVFIVSALDAPPFGAGKRSKVQFSKYFKKPVDLKVLGESVLSACDEHRSWLHSTMG